MWNWNVTSNQQLDLDTAGHSWIQKDHGSKHRSVLVSDGSGCDEAPGSASPQPPSKPQSVDSDSELGQKPANQTILLDSTSSARKKKGG